MIRNIFSILCREAITDQETNSVSYIHCIEEGATLKLPTIIPSVFLGTLWEKVGDDEILYSVRVVLASPSGKERLLLQTKELVFNRSRQRLHFKLDKLNINEFGRHEIRVYFRVKGTWRIASRLPFLIRQLAPQKAKQSAVEMTEMY